MTNKERLVGALVRLLNDAATNDGRVSDDALAEARDVLAWVVRSKRPDCKRITPGKRMLVLTLPGG